MKTKHLVALGVAAFVVYQLAKKKAPVAPATNGIGVIYAPGGTDVIMAEQFGGMGDLGFSLSKAFKSATGSLKSSLKAAIKLPLVAVKKPLSLPQKMVEALPGGKVGKLLGTAAMALPVMAATSMSSTAGAVKAIVTGKSVKKALIKAPVGVLAAVVPPKAQGGGVSNEYTDAYGNPISAARYNQLAADMAANGDQAYGMIDASGKSIQVTRAEYEKAVADYNAQQAADAAAQAGSSSGGGSSSGQSYTDPVIMYGNGGGGGGVSYSNQSPDGMRVEAGASAEEQQPAVPTEAPAEQGGFSAGLALVGGGVAAALMAFARK